MRYKGLDTQGLGDEYHIYFLNVSKLPIYVDRANRLKIGGKLGAS